MMNAWEFRWLLLAIGVVILLVVYVLGRQRRERRERELFGDTLDEEDLTLTVNPAESRADVAPEIPSEDLDAFDELLKEEAVERRRIEKARAVSTGPKPRTATAGHQAKAVPVPGPGAEPRPAPVPPAKARAAPATGPRARAPAPQAEEQMLVALHVELPRPHVISGPDLMEAAQGLHLELGEDLVFHHNVERFGRKSTVFSVANLVKPGVFEPGTIDTFTTPGVSMFLLLPGPQEGLKAFNIMLDCAQSLAARFDARVLDQSHVALTPQSIDHLREHVQLFSLRHANDSSG